MKATAVIKNRTEKMDFKVEEPVNTEKVLNCKHSRVAKTVTC